jgi:hypothetical protein
LLLIFDDDTGATGSLSLVVTAAVKGLLMSKPTATVEQVDESSESNIIMSPTTWLTALDVVLLAEEFIRGMIIILIDEACCSVMLDLLFV